MLERLKSYPFLLKFNFQFLVLFFTLFLIANLIFRIVFFLYNYDPSSELNIGGLFLSFLVGLRFDIAVFSIVNLIPAAILLLPLKFFQVQKHFFIYSSLMLLLNSPVYFLNGMDVAYFEYSGKRTTFELLVLKKDVFSFSPMLLLEYIWLLLIFAGLLYVKFYILRLWFRRVMKTSYFTVQRRVIDYILLPVLIGLLLTGMRGGLQLRSLRPAMAFFSPNYFLGHTASNSAFNVMKSFGTENSEKIHRLDEKKSIQVVRKLIEGKNDSNFISDQYPLLRKTNFQDSSKTYNVVLIVMESMNAENIGILNEAARKKDLTPNFDRLAQKGVFFSSYYSNAKRSIEAFPAILNSLPDILSTPLITSDYETNATWGIGNILKSRGYRTLFFHGGRNGSMGLDQYASISGFETYFGLNEYSAKHGMDRFDGSWGIYDDAFFIYFFEEIFQLESPYFTVIFSLSNHHPYKLPDQGWEWIKNSSLTDPEKGIRYADEVLGEFFKKAEKLPDFQNTIFIVTSDHYTFNSLKPDRDIMTMFHVPLLIYAPGILKPGRDDRISNHLNLLPTLLDLLKINTYHASAGRSLFEEPERDFTFFQNNGLYTFAENDKAVVTDFDHLLIYYRRSGNKWIVTEDFQENIKNEMYETGLSFLQVYRNTVVGNALISSEFMKVE
ncbi:MAG: sulfatase-like hydrolase/transferase [Spirochaetia bacterium]|nr:sulfatase-like hydrolase/transferase [Spirochaetia bacterium]